jgi:hypothetical protein
VPRDLESVGVDCLGALASHVTRLRHDLGKYVSMQVRWLGDNPSPDALRDAVVADLLTTRRGPAGVQTAQAVWAEFQPALVGARELVDGVHVDLSEDSDVRQLEHHMAIIAEVADRLQTGLADGDTIDRGAEAAQKVAEACRSLGRRVRARGA